MHVHICYIKHSTVQSILYTIYYICIYILSIYICLHILYTHMPIFLLFLNSFEATQRNALICCSLHFIPLLIRPCAASRPHIHWLTHTSMYTYLYTYMCIHICMSRDPAFAMVAALGFTYYTYGTLVVPVPLPLYLCQCLSSPPPAPLPQGILQPRVHTLYSVPHFDLDSDAGLVYVSVSVSVSYSAVAFEFVVRHARFVWSS